MTSSHLAQNRKIAGKRLDGHEARMVLDLDAAIALLVPLWEAEDEYRRAKLSIRTVLRVQRCMRKLLAARAAARGEAPAAPAKGARPGMMIRQATSGALDQVHASHAAAAGAGAEPSRPAQKLQEARELDAAASDAR